MFLKSRNLAVTCHQDRGQDRRSIDLYTNVVYFLLGSTMDLIDAPITCEVTPNLDAVADRCVIIRSAMAVDNQVLQVQQSGAIAVIAITPVYCT
jgi:hypothetical protein